jgi:hypothetical protein
MQEDLNFKTTNLKQPTEYFKTTNLHQILIQNMNQYMNYDVIIIFINIHEL